MLPHSTRTPRICQHCGTHFTVYTKQLKRGHGRYCSRACTAAALAGDEQARFWSKVHKTDSCWLWTGGTDHFGHGRFRIRGQQHMAHRVAYALTYGPIPPDLCVLHRCDNPPCVNPAHHFLGTRAANAADMVKKGRQQRGERSGHAKLTTADIATIRAQRAQGEHVTTLGRAFGVSAGHITRICNGLRWRHVE